MKRLQITVILITTLLTNNDFLFGQGFDVVNSSVWEDQKLKENPGLLEEYSYASIDIALVNYNALLNLKFNSPPAPEAPKKEKRKWEREAKDRLRYFGISLTFPPAPENPWGKELYLPLYFLDAEKTGERAVKINSTATVIDNVPRVNDAYKRLNADVKLEKKSVNDLQAFISQISTVALNFVSDPVAITTPNLISKVGPTLNAFKDQIGDGKKEYAFEYGLEILPFGDWKQGIVKQVDVYTIKPAGSTEPIPAINPNVVSLRDSKDAMTQLNNIGTAYPQILIIYRVTNYNFTNFSLAIDDVTIRKQKLELANLQESNFISKNEADQLNALIAIKDDILKLETHQAAYYEKINLNQSYSSDLMGAVSDYYNAIYKIVRMKDDYKSSDLFTRINDKNCNFLKGIADSYLVNAHNGRTLNGAQKYVEALFMEKNNIKSGSLNLLYQRMSNLKFLDSKEISGRSDFRDITNSVFYNNGKDYLAEVEKEIYSQKYKINVDKLNGFVAFNVDTKALRNKLVNEITNETSDYCTQTVNKAVDAYDALEASAAQDIAKARKSYDQVIQDVQQLSIPLTLQETCVGNLIVDPANGIQDAILALYKQYFNDFKLAKKSYLDQLVKNLSGPDLANRDRLLEFVKITNDLKDQVDQKSKILKDESSFRNCFAVK